MKYLFFDLSETMSAYALIDNNKLKSYDSKSMLSDCFGESLHKLNQWMIDVIYKTQPDIIGIEDIYSNSITGYKKLSKIQGIAELICYNYNKRQPKFVMATTIRSMFKLNIKKILTEKQFKKKYKNKDYKEYLKDSNHYNNKYKYINFNTEHIRIIDNKLVDIRKQKQVKISKKGNIRTTGKTIKEYDYAKKIVVIEFINRYYKLDFTFEDNDIADAIIGALYLSKKGFIND